MTTSIIIVNQDGSEEFPLITARIAQIKYVMGSGEQGSFNIPRHYRRFDLRPVGHPMFDRVTFIDDRGISVMHKAGLCRISGFFS